MKGVDLRSDTITHPTDEMRHAMAEAEVGDDVYGEDPSVNRLEETAAELLGKDSALFVSSGTMGNLIAALTHTQRGDEVIMGSESHMFWNEVGGTATLGGLQVRLVSNDFRGMMDPVAVGEAIRTRGNLHFPRTSLLCLENTHNRCNGGVLNGADTKALADVARAHGVAIHLDGARIFNAAVALKVPVRELAQEVDDVAFCLSKGLSAPAGSLLCGRRDFVDRARKWRKMLGGGMRQAGVLASAGLVAIRTMVERLADDHANARHLAKGLMSVPGLNLDPDMVQTNIVFVELDDRLGDVPEFIGRLTQEGVKVSYPGGRLLRMVTHRHVSVQDVDEALATVSKVAQIVSCN
jgi:threonine aldolase